MKPKSPRTMKQIGRLRKTLRTEPRTTALTFGKELSKMMGRKISKPSIERMAHGEGLPSNSGSVSSETILAVMEYCDGREGK